MDTLPLWPILLGLDWIVRLLLVARVIMRARPVPVTLAWMILLLFPVPFVGAAAYAIVGEVRLGSRRLRLHRALTDSFSERATVLWKARSQEWPAEFDDYKHISHLGTSVGDMPPLRGNALRLIAGSDRFVEELVADIDGAMHTVHMVMYIWMERGAGATVADAVARAARRGVRCRVLVDGVGSKRFLRSKLPERLREAGAEVAAALPVSAVRMLFARLDLRNHRKVAVIDGWTAYTGSGNITDSSFGYRPLRGIGPWIDAMVRVQGPAAKALELTFLRDWAVEADERVAERLEEMLGDAPVPEGGSIVQVVPSGPGSGPSMNAMRDALLTAIYSARRELILTTPYFVPDEATKEAIVAAALRGVAVTLVVPRKSDGVIVGAASRACYPDLLAAGVRVKEYREGLLHAKTMTIDGTVGVIGSANLDMRSFYLNFEVTLFVFDTDQASVLRMLQVEYMEQSSDLFMEQWNERPGWARALDNTARLLSPLL
jgi:cardiolipin synthase A/B